jgi:hypothetical protein
MLKVRIVIVQNNYYGLTGSFESDNWIFEGTSGRSERLETMLRKAPNRQKTCYLLQTNSNIPYFMCDWENNFHHFVNLQEIPEGFYTYDQKQCTYKGRDGTNDDCCHPLQPDLWDYLLKNHLSTNDDSLGTEGIDSESDKADANLAQYGAGPNNKDGSTGTCTKPSADPDADAIESSVVGEKRGDHAEKNCEIKDSINGAGKGGQVDEGGNVVNDKDEMTKIDKIQQEALTKNKLLHFINAEEYAGALEVYEKLAKKIMVCLLFHGLRKTRHMCKIIF